MADEGNSIWATVASGSLTAAVLAATASLVRMFSLSREVTDLRTRMTLQEAKVATTEGALGRLDERMKSLEQKMDGIDRKLDRLLQGMK